MKKVSLAFIALWIPCGFVNYCLTLGDSTHEFPWCDNRGFAVTMGLMGPFGIPATVLDTPHHWLLKPLTTEQRWEAFRDKWPSLGRETFEQDWN